MTTRLNPYVQFDGQARSAMEFYRQVFGGELTVNTMAEFGIEGPQADQIMHAQLETASGYWIMAADTPPGMEFSPGSRVTMILNGDDEAELGGYFAELSDGGSIEVPLAAQNWGDSFGICTDKFGVRWMVNISGARQDD